jgi:hypothetical protein
MLGHRGSSIFFEEVKSMNKNFNNQQMQQLLNREIGIGGGPESDFTWSQNSNIMKIDQEVGSRIDMSDKGSQI